MLKTAVCDLLNIRYPVFQGGMAHISTWELVSAVSNAGGLGIIGAGFYQPDWLKNQIQLTKEHTDQPFGINIQMASPFLNQIIDIIIREAPPVVTTGAGNPERIIGKLKKAKIKIIPVINNARNARRMEEAGADAIIAEGMESGGHIGNTTTMVLVPEVTDCIRIPVIAAGGICDGRGMAAAFTLGATGIQMGTRFACSTECTASHNYKRKILESVSPATTVTREILGYPQRSLKNDASERFLELEKAGASIEELKLFDQGRMYLGLVEGDTDEGSLLAGQVAARIKDIKPVKDIIESTVNEAERILSNLNKLISEETR